MTKKLDVTDMSHPDYDAKNDPTHPFYEADDTDGNEKDTSGEETKKVGPGYPPDEYKYKKGCPSPNPKGRPRKDSAMKSDLAKVMQEALNEKVTITQDRKKIVLTKAALGIRQLVNQYANGDRHARRDVIHYSPLLGIALHTPNVIAEALGTDQQAIVDAYVRRQQAALEPAADDHVKAPPDLVDDDVAKTEPAAPPAATPKPAAPVPPFNGQPLDKNGRPMAHDLASINAERERRLALQKKNQEGS